MYLEYQKKYRIENKDTMKQHYNDNRDAILEKSKEVLTCECGRKITYSNKSQHKKSKIHLKNIIQDDIEVK